jgi:hypothetical protein
MDASTNQTSTGAVSGWSVWLNTVEGIQLGGAYCWNAWHRGNARSGAAHSRALAEEFARAALGGLMDDARRRTLRRV